MKTREATIYNCDFCNRMYLRKKACAKHEKRCNKNPENDRACFHCEFLQKKKETIEEYYTSHTVELFWCGKLDIFLHPPSVEHKGNAIDIGEQNEPMKKECEHQEHLF